VDLFRELLHAGVIKGVLGNHDGIITHPELRPYFHLDALEALDWSVAQLNEKCLRCISFLPEIIHNENYTIVHGTPRDPLKEYFVNSLQYYQLYNEWIGQILFVGHSHMPFYMEGTKNRCSIHLVQQETNFLISYPSRYVINPGSVGKPRDSDVRASFGLWDTDENKFHFFREPYNYRLTIEKMKKAGLPDLLIDSLSLGI
jgi:diadenosine tetraphosphatase ApaH/serine/threonine PP2A family protein phosphatase